MLASHPANERGAADFVGPWRRLLRRGLGAGSSDGDRAGLGSRGGRGRSGCRRLLRLCFSRCGSSGAIRIDHGNDRLNRHGLALIHLDLFQHTGCRRRNFRVDFIRRNFKQGLIPLDLVARFFQPLGNSAFKNALAHLGHDHIDGHDYFLREVKLKRR